MASIFDKPDSPRGTDILGILVAGQLSMHLTCAVPSDKGEQIGVCEGCGLPVYDRDSKVADEEETAQETSLLYHLDCFKTGDHDDLPITFEDLCETARDGEMTICAICHAPILDEGHNVQRIYNEHAARAMYESLASGLTGAPSGGRLYAQGVFHLVTLKQWTQGDPSKWHQQDGEMTIDDPEWQGYFTYTRDDGVILVLGILRHYAESADEEKDPRAIWLCWYRGYAPYETIAKPRHIQETDQEWSEYDRALQAAISFSEDDTSHKIDLSDKSLPGGDFPDSARTLADILGMAGVPASALFDPSQYNRVVYWDDDYTPE